MDKTELHRPVLLRETIELLNIHDNSICLDGTGGAGGHSEAILELIPFGKLVILDLDSNVESVIKQRLENRGDYIFLNIGFENLKQASNTVYPRKFNCILLDLGMSSMALDDPERGFSHKFDGPLDMRFDQDSGDLTSADIIDKLTENQLYEIFARYGEQPGSRRLANAVKKALPQTTGELRNVISGVLGDKRSTKAFSRIFQALRIYVNREMDRLRDFLNEVGDYLEPGGRLAVISYHSLEDRTIKEFLQRESKNCICPPGMPVCTCEHKASFRIITGRPVTPEKKEIIENSRARSAKLRVGEKL